MRGRGRAMSATAALSGGGSGAGSRAAQRLTTFTSAISLTVRSSSSRAAAYSACPGPGGFRMTASAPDSSVRKLAATSPASKLPVTITMRVGQRSMMRRVAP